MTRSTYSLADPTGARLTVTVVIATYCRVERVVACLEGLRSQARPADEVIVVVHASDDVSARRVEDLSRAWRALRCVRVDGHGSVTAYNAGLDAARGDVVAYVDDDAVPTADWLMRIEKTFAGDDRIAGVGGRDVVVQDGGVLGARRPRILRRRPNGPTVGRIQWFGRMIANHHLGTGEARDVDVLKGANMSFRRHEVASLGFDERLRGPGAVVHSELSICLPLRRRGLRVVYDPRIVVMHYPSPRPHGDERDDLRAGAVFAATHNEALQILDYFSPSRGLVFLAWGLAIGTTGAPGLAVSARDALARRPAVWSRFWAAQRGRAAAWRTRRRPRPVRAVQEASAGARATGNADAPVDRNEHTPAPGVFVSTSQEKVSDSAR